MLYLCGVFNCNVIVFLKQILFIFSALLLSLGIAAQEIVVIGQVLSAEDATPLEAANVWFKGTRIGATTNEEGFFMLRSPEPQKVLTVSIVGYKKRNIRLDYGKDQMVEVLMQEESSVLDEIVVIQKADDEAFALLKRVRENRQRNNPANMVNVATRRQTTMFANMANVRGRVLRKRLFEELKSGAIEQTDTSYTLPVYGLRRVEDMAVYEDSVVSEVTDEREEAVSVMEAGNWKQVLENYVPEVDPYRPYTTVFGSNFLNPTAPNARSYYNVYITDSMVTASGKKYFLRFRPKRDEGLLFRGTMAVDSATAAITGVEWRIPSYVPVNFLHNYSYAFEAERMDSVFYTKSERQLVDLQIVPTANKKNGAMSAILGKYVYCSDTRPTNDAVGYREVAVPEDSCIEAGTDIESIWAGIDSLNQTRVQRLAAWTVDLILNQYLHIWMIDLGPVLNLYHFNQYEGNSPRLSLRSGKSFSKNFTFGGYYGYGFKDRQHKYGGQVQWRFGRGQRNYLAFNYDHKVERYGYDDILMYDENRVQDVDHLTTSIEQIHKYPTLAMHKRMKLTYAYEKPGLRLGFDARAEEIMSNRYMAYIQNGRTVDKISLMALKADLRLSWKEHTLDEYFHRIYLKSNYPVVRLTAEFGGLTCHQDAVLYGRFNLYARQTVPVGFGRLIWSVHGSATVGTVPWPLLPMAHTSRGSYYYDAHFALLNQMEFMSDLYIASNLRYQTRGYIFGYIPGIKRLGIREDVLFKIGYGHLGQKHSQMLALPSMVQPWGKTPYIEAGFGFSNILYVGDIHFIWRVTHRDNPNAIKFGIRWRVGL